MHFLHGVIALFLVYACVLPSHPTLAEICTEDVCEYHFDVQRHRTMTYVAPGGADTFNVELEEGTNKLKIVPNNLRPEGSDDLIGTYPDPDDVVTAGGFPRNVVTINGKFPGPAIEVMENAEVVIKVTNHLEFDALSIHWHGLYMRKTPFMDGVPYLTQCPIPPSQSFTYRFRAYPPGTHWYHPHIGNLRADGMYGMLVIHPQLPEIPEYSAMVADWWPWSAETMEVFNPFAIFHGGTGENHVPAPDRDYTQDGVQTGALNNELFVTVVNGKGKGPNGEAFPLQVYSVDAGSRVRIRVVHAGLEYAYYVSVDGHTIDVVASDGYDLTPLTVTHIIIQPGETTDFELTANQAVGNYWMRLRTTRDGKGFDVVPDEIIREGFAIIHYEGAPADQEPTTNAHQCNAVFPCTVFNCPFAGYASSYNKNCLTYNNATSTMPQAKLDSEYGVSDPDFDEHFVTFHFAGGTSVNGKRFVDPTVPLFQPYADHIVSCEDTDCTEGCNCTQILDLPFNRTIQMIIANIQPGGGPVFAHHPIHIHGHGFAVLKVGYPDYNKTTGKWTMPNEDVICDNVYCNPARWNGAPPTDLNQDNPPVKDTLSIPARGYAVVRFRSDNPGFWIAHCHTEQHVSDGMAIVFNEAGELHPDVPSNFPTCFHYDMSDEEFKKYDSAEYGKKVVTDDGGVGVKQGQSGETSGDAGVVEDKTLDRTPIDHGEKHDDAGKSKEEGEKTSEEHEKSGSGEKSGSAETSHDSKEQDDNMRKIEDDEVVVKLPVLIGTAVGFILLGAVIAIVPTVLLLVGMRAKGPSSSDAGVNGVGVKGGPTYKQGAGLVNPGYDGETKGHM